MADVGEAVAQGKQFWICTKSLPGCFDKQKKLLDKALMCRANTNGFSVPHFFVMSQAPSKPNDPNMEFYIHIVFHPGNGNGNMQGK